jgi:hypothetical protein
MCSCRTRGLTACLVCVALVVGPFGAPSASVVGQILTAPSSTTSIATVGAGYSIPNTTAGFVHRLPIELPKPPIYKPDV